MGSKERMKKRLREKEGGERTEGEKKESDKSPRHMHDLKLQPNFTSTILFRFPPACLSFFFFCTSLYFAALSVSRRGETVVSLRAH